MDKPLFSPSLMCMDFLNIRRQLEFFDSRAESFHVDIMDGHFVPNITLSPCFVKALSKAVKIPMACHLMVTDPDKLIDPLAAAGAGLVSPHAEPISACAFRIIDRIRGAGMRAGVALNPATPLSQIEYYIEEIDRLTIMTVDPGFAGSPFIRPMLKKIEQARELKIKRGFSYIIEVDGACGKNTFHDLFSAGAECFVLGSASLLFGPDIDLETAWERMLKDFEVLL